MPTSLYQIGDIPGHWDGCPLGRICRKNGKPFSTQVAANILGVSDAWVNGYINRFDARINSVNSYDDDFMSGYKIGKGDRALHFRDHPS